MIREIQGGCDFGGYGCSADDWARRWKPVNKARLNSGDMRPNFLMLSQTDHKAHSNFCPSNRPSVGLLVEVKEKQKKKKALAKVQSQRLNKDFDIG